MHKNDVQVENLKAAHLKDGIAHTRFMYWLKTNSGEFPVTELSASQKLEEFRAMQNGFIGPSLHRSVLMGSMVRSFITVPMKKVM